MYWKNLIAAASVLGLFFSHGVFAEDNYTYAKLISAQELTYPEDAQTKQLEGWAYYTYNVDVEGRVNDIKIVESNGLESLNDALIRHLESQVYEPATLNGHAVAQRGEFGRSTFILTGAPRAADRTFYRRYKRARSAIAEGKLDDAQSLLQELAQVKERGLYEELYLQFLYSGYFELAGDQERAYAHAQRVLHFDQPGDSRFVEQRYFIPYLVSSYQYELSSMMLGDAMASAAKLNAIAPAEEVVQEVVNHAQQIAEKAEAMKHSMNGSIPAPVYGGENARLRVALLKKELELSEVTGEIEAIAVRCDRGMKAFEPSAGFTWTIPDSWEECALVIEGKVGSTFRLTEYPPRTMASN